MKKREEEQARHKEEQKCQEMQLKKQHKEGKVRKVADKKTLHEIEKKTGVSAPTYICTVILTTWCTQPL